MPTVMYLLRAPIERISRALYTADDTEALVIRVDHIDSKSPGQFAEILQPGTKPSLLPGQSLSAPELLELVLNAQKIITL
jgi:hypothetical protein